MSYTETFEVSDMTSEVIKGNRWRDSRKETQGSPCWTRRLERRGGFTGGDHSRQKYRVRTARDRRLDVDVACERALSLRRSRWSSRIEPIQPIRTTHRDAS